jgi:hypothetical protein
MPTEEELLERYNVILTDRLEEEGSPTNIWREIFPGDKKEAAALAGCFFFNLFFFMSWQFAQFTVRFFFW